jgi:hypothetical protein
MANIRDFIIREELALDGFQFHHVNDVNAYGTSEGVQKAWDERGRGRKKPQSSSKATKPAVKAVPSKKLIAWAKSGYEALKSDDRAIKHIESGTKAKQIAFKHMWFAKRLGDFTQSFEGFHDLTSAIYKVVESLAKAAVGVGGVHEVATAIHHAVIVLAPVIHHLVAAGASAVGTILIR